MKVLLLKQTPILLPSFFRQLTTRLLFTLGLVIAVNSLIWAEGSKDLLDNPTGKRMFLDTRDPQQMKVYVKSGEYINVGASHLGFPEGVGFIKVYRPDGSEAVTFGNPIPASSNTGIIQNNVQEMAGPTGGGNIPGANGYVPAVFQATMEGIWTVVFDYSVNYSQNANFTNITNSAPWTRTFNQQQAYRRAILAWDITVTSNAPGNMVGNTPHIGRLYSNEYISLINGNNQLAFPTFYVQTRDGYTYEVKIDSLDPYRFPISSNNLGLVNGLGQPTYKSKAEASFTRSADPSTWDPSAFYLYEPQAEDIVNSDYRLVNNKIFFNVPDPTMPATALVSDIYHDHPQLPTSGPYPPAVPASPLVSHTTWLNSPVQPFILNSIQFVGATVNGLPCAPGVIQFQKGGYFVFNTNLGGSITLQLDLNNNGYDPNDPQDTVIQAVLNAGTDSVYWNGWINGAPVPVQPSLNVHILGNIQYGQIHIALTDVEGNKGGVRLKRLTPVPGLPDDLFFYDHSELLGFGPTAVSGGGTPGNALPTNIPYSYSVDLGNDKYIDEWAFREHAFDSLFIVKVDSNCVCEQNNTPIITATGDGSFCDDDTVVLTASNSVPGTGDLTYTWSGPASYNFSETVGAVETSTATINNITTAGTGSYQVIAATDVGCSDTLSLNIVVNPVPDAMVIAGGGTFCAGGEVVLTATNTVPGIATIDYTWTGPGVPANMATGTVAGGDPITLTLTDVQVADAGSYSLTLVSELGCTSDPISVTVNVTPTPILSGTGGGSYCVDDDITLTATNSAPGIGTMTCVWNGPNIFNVTQNVSGSNPITLPLNNVNNAFEGVYTLVCSVGNCADTVSFDVVINAAPQIGNIGPVGPFCSGDAVTLTAININTDTGPINYTWTGPNPNNTLFPFSGTGPQAGPFPVTIPNLTTADGGLYTLVLSTLGGCESVPQSITLAVNPSPEITITGGGDVCNGQDVTLTATNSTLGVGPIIFIWSDPNGDILNQGVTAANVPCTATINNVSTANNGIYTIFKTIDATGCDATETVTLNVLPGLNIIDPTPDSTYCEFGTVVLTATNTVDAGDLTYTWNGPNGKVLGPFTVGSFEPLIAIINEASLDCSGTWTLDVTSAIGCNSNTTQVEVTIAEGVRIVSVTGGGEYCLNAPVALNGTGEGSATSVDYTWTDPNGTIIGSGNTTAAGPFPANATTNLGGTYILEVIADPSGCSDSDTVAISFIALPEVMVLNNDTTLCDLDTLEICGQATTINIGTFSYVWTTPTGETLTGTHSGNIPFCDIISPMENYGEGPYILVITSSGCTSLPDTFNVNLNPNPEISIVLGGGTYCVGDTANICFTNTNTDVVGFFYTCILPDGTQITGQTLTNETICLPVTQSGTICCSIESFDGCVSSLACASVTFEPSADLSVTANTPVCANETLVLSGTNSLPCTGTVTYAWNGPNGFTFVGTAPCGGPFIAELPNPVSGVYCLIAPLNSQCPDTACITVVVNPVPIVVNNTITGGGTFCAGDDVVLTAQVSISNNTPITYTWCQNDVPIPGQTGTVPSGSTVTLDLGQVATNDGGEYCLKLTSSDGCINNPAACTQVTVNPSPEILTVTGGGTYCEGVDVMLNGTGTPGLGNVTYMWMGPNGFVFNGGPVPSAGPFPATVSDIELLGAGTYTLTVKLGNCEDVASVVVEVNPKPIITIISGSGTFCVGETVTYSFEIDPNGASSVDWTFSCPGFDTSGTVTTITIITFDLVVNSAHSCTITAESSDGCEAIPMEIQTDILVVDPPVLSVNGIPGPGGSNGIIVCQGEQLILTTTNYPGTEVTYEWFKDGVLIGETSTPNFPVEPPMAGVYTVTVTVDGCSATSEPVEVTIPEAPVANDDEYTSTTVTPISGNVSGNDTGGQVTYTVVTPPTSGTLTLNQDGTFTYTPASPPAQLVTFTYEICLVDCPEQCDQATVTIIYLIDCLVPNVLTPNGDGVNDVLVIDCIPPVSTNLPNPSRLRIFNRWGDEIATFEPYLNEEGWDATYGSDKKEVPAATYFYLFERDKASGDKPISGYIKVVR
jgi:gliding motility-associated-like protein